SHILSSHVFHIVCQHLGSLDFKSLDQILRQRFTVADEVLLEVLTDFDKFVVVEGKEKRESFQLSHDSIIVAKTSLRVCQTLPGKCAGCQNLHLCRYFVCGYCRFGAKCKNSHGFDSPHNTLILRRLGLQNLGNSELFQLLLQNDPSILPEVCSHYNKGNGEHGSCKYETSCTNLHLCQHFLQDNCKFGAACKRAHSFDANAMKMLNGRGISAENITNVCKIYKNRFLISSYKEKMAILPCVERKPIPSTVAGENSGQTPIRPVSKSDPKEICLFFIRKECSFKDKCIRVHYHLPYKWQVLDKNEQTWKDLQNVEEIERAFCNPANEISPGPQQVDFNTMMCGAAPVRRLSTASSVTKPPNFILTTEWLWYWKNEKGGWTEYGQGVDTKHATPFSSQELENIYQSNPHSEVSVTSEKHTYILYMKDMYQQNIHYKTKRDIQRRPRFVSASEVDSKIKSESSSSSVLVPAHWDRGALPSYSYKLVPLPRTDNEFLRIEKLFKETMPHYTVKSIQRNQNSSLWKVFQWQKEQMKARNGGQEVNERLLFHGTEQSLIDAICEHNFDWRICGIHGTVYGKGSYFARDASYSDHYSQGENSCKRMFVARVLVGHYTHGQRDFVRPPKISANGFYDSCVDNETNPSIFVIFEKYQIYPEFIIEYAPVESKCLIS
ncbi:protein mono-ADP-ribosyltransferase PARP12-like, partial [Electrophorus electricus]|uniref:protein mono-ADP-ribosyltransferase PARP12-like n=1 Tax=Electrophorus electricus TaxID=8005 RepID=UPI0015D08F3D